MSRVGTMDEFDTGVEQTEVEPSAPLEDVNAAMFEEPGPDEELWPEGPTFGMVDEWRKHFKNIYITSVTPEIHYAWRVLKRSEYREIVKDLEIKVASETLSQAEATMENEEKITAVCLLYPEISLAEIASDEMGGVASILSQQILEASGFNALEIRML